MRASTVLKSVLLSSIFGILCPSVSMAAVIGPLPPSDLKCEYLTDPTAIDVQHPRFYWVLGHTERDQAQSAYQVQVSTEEHANTGDQWDSGKIMSAQSTQVEYAGKGLVSGQTYYWKVRYWDRQGRPSDYSEVARFGVGLLSRSDWTAKWIGTRPRLRNSFRDVNFIQVGLGLGESRPSGANEFRKEFTLAAAPTRGRVYVSGLGYYELRINGQRVGDHVLDPGWTAFDKRVLYETYDVTPLLRRGKNAIAATLGEGWFAERILMLQLQVEEEGGAKAQIITDESWKTHAGPVIADSVYRGEEYDARMETLGWDRAGFDDAGWSSAVAVTPPSGVLSAQMMPPIRVVDTLVPLKMTNPSAGAYVFDMGQNFSGWAKLRVRGPRATRVRMRYSELVFPNGTLNTETTRRAQPVDIYTLKGDGEEEYEPKFTYHGFRYVEVTGYPGVPKLDSVRGRVVHSDVKPTGGFASSNQMLNDLQRAIVWGLKTNLHSIPTDCPQRDERFGWMGDVHWAAEAIISNFDMAAFYTNFLRSIHDEQGDDGSVPATVPVATPDQRNNDPGYGAGYPAFVWYLYQHYGDRRILEQHYEGIKAWVSYLSSRAKDGIIKDTKWGDWIAPMRTHGAAGAVWNGENNIDLTPGDLVSTFYYVYSVGVAEQAARILGKTGEAEKFHALDAQIREAFNQKFYNPERKTYAAGSQASQALALYLDFPPPKQRADVLRLLADDIVYAKDTHLSTGIVGTKYVMPVLTRFGRSDLAYDLVTQTTFPSWGYMLKNGATTIWELWSKKTGPAMNSQNHPAFGSVGQWLYTALAGINVEPDHPGYERIRIQPEAVGDLEWVSGSMNTIRGLVSSLWKRTPERFTLDVIVPVGSEADIAIPKPLSAGVSSSNEVLKGLPPEFTIREGDRTVWQNGFKAGQSGVRSARDAGRSVEFVTGSGHYVFELQQTQ